MAQFFLKYAFPDWLIRIVNQHSGSFNSVEEQMEFVVGLSGMNVEHGTGGPFAAGIFHKEKKEIIGVGINMVTHHHCSMLHAEIVAIMFTQAGIRDYDLGLKGLELITSAEPCDMCLEAIRWSGIRDIVCGARREDVEAIGFCEGFRAQQESTRLTLQGYTFQRDVLREKACRVLNAYKQQDRIIYNPTQET